jgi:hypothetical protein
VKAAEKDKRCQDGGGVRAPLCMPGGRLVDPD